MTYYIYSISFTVESLKKYFTINNIDFPIKNKVAGLIDHYLPINSDQINIIQENSTSKIGKNLY